MGVEKEQASRSVSRNLGCFTSASLGFAERRAKLEQEASGLKLTWINLNLISR